MSFKIKKPSVIRKANQKHKENREKALNEKKVKIQKKVDKYKEDNCYIDGEDNKLVKDQTFNQSTDSNPKPITNNEIKPIINVKSDNVTIIHSYENMILETSCPAQIIDDLLVVDEKKCTTKKIDTIPNQIQLEKKPSEVIKSNIQEDSDQSEDESEEEPILEEN